MEPKKLLLNATEKELKLFHELATGNEDYQIAACDGVETYINIDQTIITPANLLMGYVSKEKKFCAGRYAENNFALTPDSGLLRVILDCRKQDDSRFHVNHDGSYVKLTKNNSNENSLLMIFIECPTFIQFSLYDGLLNNDKIIHLLTTKSELKSRMRSIAYSILGQHFNSFHDYISKMDAEKNDPKE